MNFLFVEGSFVKAPSQHCVCLWPVEGLGPALQRASCRLAHGLGPSFLGSGRPQLSIGGIIQAHCIKAIIKRTNLDVCFSKALVQTYFYIHYFFKGHF